MQSFLNELSLPKFQTSAEVRMAFRLLGECYQKVERVGVKEVKIQSTFYAHEFAPGYFFIHLLDDHQVDDDLKTLLKGAVGNVPFIDDMLKTYESENNSALEMSVDDVPCVGLGLASEAIFNTVSFSYQGNNYDELYYDLNLKIFTEDEDSNLVERQVLTIARNIATPDQPEHHTPYINNHILSQIEDGKELWIKRTELFPNLEFCAAVKVQLARYHYNTLGFQQLILRLLALQLTASNFDGNPVKPEDFSTLTSKESASRLRDFANELTILCPDGEYRLFDWHARFTPGAGRIHFIPYENRQVILVGSIANQNTIK